MFTERQIDLIFGNISEIYGVAKSFMADLERSVSQCESVHYALVGQCFLQHVSLVYSVSSDAYFQPVLYQNSSLRKLLE